VENYYRELRLLQNPVGAGLRFDGLALAVSRRRSFGPQAAKQAFLSNCSYKAKVLREPRELKIKIDDNLSSLPRV
jgi:hypothetical protein